MPRAKEPSLDQFLKDVSGHVMTVIRDDGVNRHIRFRRPDTGNMAFELLTWPGYLCYTGDMGTYVFSRIEDMFKFFRPERKEREITNLFINPYYWSEKVKAADRDGVDEFDAEVARDAVMTWMKDYEFSPKSRELVMDNVLSRLDDGEHWFVTAAYDFRNGDDDFEEFFHTNLRSYTFRYIWCCYAMVWGIDQYDRARSEKTT